MSERERKRRRKRKEGEEEGEGEEKKRDRSGEMMDRGAWWATAHSVAQSQTRLKRQHSTQSGEGLFLKTQILRSSTQT